MKDLSFAQEYALIALNAQDISHMTTVKKVALRAVSAAVVLECYLNGELTEKNGQLELNPDKLKDAALYEEPVLSILSAKKSRKPADLCSWVTSAARLPVRRLKKLEHFISDYLKDSSLLEEIPNILGCDMFYVTAGVTIKEYCCEITTYSKITESLRAEVLEDIALTDEAICTLWLLRESGCIYDIFSNNEHKKVLERINSAREKKGLAKTLFNIHIRRSAETAITNFLKKKKYNMHTEIGTGINFTFPFLERSQSVFIDTEKYFSNAVERLADVEARLTANGHKYTVLHEGQVPLIKIDNIVYEAIPDAIAQRIPIQGVRLRQYFL